jgi:hypothetical protein
MMMNKYYLRSKKEYTKNQIKFLIFVLSRDKLECWDAARTMSVQEAYEKTVHCYRLSMRMLKIATYVVLSIGVLLSALVSKGALLLMTNSVAKVQEVRNEYIQLFKISWIRRKS